jgi:uncharacterized membrane protein YkoI
MNRIPLATLAAALLCSLPACKGNGNESAEAHETPVKQQPPTSLAAGIAAAQKSEPGLKFLAAEIENEGGKVICSVLFAKGDAAREINIDASNGKVVNAEDEKLGSKAKAIVQAPGATTNATQAIEAALKKVPGTWASEIKLENEGGTLMYEVTLAGGKEPMRAQVSAADGSVKKVSELDEEEGEEGEQAEKGEEHEKGEGKEKH